LEELSLEEEDKCSKCPFYGMLHPNEKITKHHEMVVLNGIGSKYALHFRFNTIEELNEFFEALKPLGYSYRFPMR
jgi:Holliday junction resolvasome RuvABC DNA-binding subunit